MYNFVSCSEKQVCHVTDSHMHSLMICSEIETFDYCTLTPSIMIGRRVGETIEVRIAVPDVV